MSFLTSPSNSEDTSPATSPDSGIRSVDDSESGNRSWGKTTLVPEGTYDDRNDGGDVQKNLKDAAHLHPLSPLPRGASELIQHAPSPTLTNGDKRDDFLFGVDARLEREQGSSSPVTTSSSSSGLSLSSETSSPLSSRSPSRQRTLSRRRVTIGGHLAPPTPPFTPTHRRVTSSISSLSTPSSTASPLPGPSPRAFHAPPEPIASVILPLSRPSKAKPTQKTHHRRRSSAVRRTSGRARKKYQERGLSRDFFLIIGLCVGLACACIVVFRPTVAAIFSYGTHGGVLEFE